MRRLEAFGERIAARDPDRQTAEIHIRIALMNLIPVTNEAILRADAIEDIFGARFEVRVKF